MTHPTGGRPKPPAGAGDRINIEALYGAADLLFERPVHPCRESVLRLRWARSFLERALARSRPEAEKGAARECAAPACAASTRGAPENAACPSGAAPGTAIADLAAWRRELRG